MPQEQIDLEVKNFKACCRARRWFAYRRDLHQEGQGRRAEGADRRHPANPNLSEVDRNRLYAHGMARLQYLTADAKEKIDAGRKVVGELETNIASGVSRPTDPSSAWRSSRRSTAATGIGQPDHGGGAGAHVAGRHLRPCRRPCRPRCSASSRPARSNQAIPPEGRALLDHIAGRNRRPLRRPLWRQDNSFQGYADHPRVAEPITSGPTSARRLGGRPLPVHRLDLGPAKRNSA
jgi:hypothetical protein